MSASLLITFERICSFTIKVRALVKLLGEKKKKNSLFMAMLPAVCEMMSGREGDMNRKDPDKPAKVQTQIRAFAVYKYILHYSVSAGHRPISQYGCAD